MTRRWCLPLAGLMLTTGTLAAATTSASAATPAAGARPRIAVQDNLSWAGYAEHHNLIAYTSVSADWVQPAVRCTGRRSQVYLFVGLDGYANGFYNDTGTHVTCRTGTPVYSAWASMYPKGPVVFSNTLRPGDQITASVEFRSPDAIRTIITDTTQGWSRSISGPDPAPASAEVIADDPAPPPGIVPLADFGTVEFTNVRSNGQDMVDPTRMIMVRNSGTGLKASTTGLLARTHFSVTWLHRN